MQIAGARNCSPMIVFQSPPPLPPLLLPMRSGVFFIFWRSREQDNNTRGRSARHQQYSIKQADTQRAAPTSLQAVRVTTRIVLGARDKRAITHM